MANNWLRIIHIDNSIQLSWQRGQSAPRSASPIAFEHPFDAQVLGELRWYLEEYLSFPYGIEPDKAKKIEQKFQEWGHQLFELVFSRTSRAWDFFQEATREGLDQCEINICSDDPVVLNLPWELLYSPDYQFLAPSLAGMYRSLSNYAVRSPKIGELTQNKLNILLIIARPYGEKDVALKTIARPLLEALKPIQQFVNLKVLRPPSFHEFQQELNTHKGFYQIVHFDGHGDFDADSAGFQHSFGSKGQGVLVFENTDGSPQIVTAAQIAQSLNDCRVPIFVLNACKSAQEGNGSFSSVATRLVSLDAKGVVAMAYNVQVEAAKHFMGRFYQQLVTGTNISTAVAAARREVVNQRLRPSPKGNLPLADWMVPMLYQQETYTPFVPASNTTQDIPDLDSFSESTANLVGFSDEGSYGFIGRDYDILRLERAFRQNNIVLLQGMGGIGKTELTCGFARWLNQTQGREKIFFMSFERGATLNHVVNQVGREIWGETFFQYPVDKQRKAVLEYLQTQPCLLIWDNFEPVTGFPSGNQPLLSDLETDTLKQFLKQLRNGQSWVLITSRREESWLDCGYRLLNLKGLSLKDAEDFAAKVLETVGVDRAKLPKEYLDLLKLLGGHPLALRVVLPRLKTQTPSVLIEHLRQGLDTFQGVEEEGRDKSLTVSLNYSFANLSELARKHLPFVALFSERVSLELLYSFAFKESPNHEYRQAYQVVFGENLTRQEWVWILTEAVSAGILEYQGGTIYKIHPALPWFLRQQLCEQHSEEEIRELEKKLLVLYAMLADESNRRLISEFDKATRIILLEEPNFLQNLRIAEQYRMWEYAQAILQALGKVYERSDRKAEFDSLRQRAQGKIAISTASSNGEDTSALSMYLLGVDANEALKVADLITASENYQTILNELTALNDPSVNDKIAGSNHNLGAVAQEQRQFEKAEAYYQKALKIYQDGGDEYNAAKEYHHLGIIRQEQGQLEEAKTYYQQALEIFQKKGDVNAVAAEYHQLGWVAQEQGEFEQAKDYYKEALKVCLNAGDKINAASEYHHLGGVAQAQGELEEAKGYYKEALKICEDSEIYHKAAGEYYQLGTVAQQQMQFEEAEAYYQKAYEIFQQNEDWYKVSMVLGYWGYVLEAQQKWDESVQIYIEALYIHREYFQESEDWIKDIFNLTRMLKILGESQFDSIWRSVTGQDCPQDLRSAIQLATQHL